MNDKALLPEISGSVPSLGAGLIFGSALAIGAMQASQSPPQYAVQTWASAILAGMMGYRFYNSGKVMPAGVICALSLISLARIGMKCTGLIDIGEKPQ